jgi:uncharacterized protein (TIGR03118 family)
VASRRALAAALCVAGGAALAATQLARSDPPPNAFVVRPLVSDGAVDAARVTDRDLVNSWGLAASPTGPWWTANEAKATSTLYAGDGAKQALTVSVDGGPTGVVYHGGRDLVIRVGRARGPARFVYACEDGTIRAWTPTVPTGWSTSSVVAVDLGGEAAVFRGIAIATVPGGGTRLYATDFHNGRVDVFDGRWHRVRRPGAFLDPKLPEWYAPFGIQTLGGHVFVSYVFRAPVNGNDAPTGGYLDEFDLDGRLVARVASGKPLNAPWGMALAPDGFGPFGGDLIVGDFGDGRLNAFRRDGRRWSWQGTLRGPQGKPLELNGLWAIAFGNGRSAGPADTLFFASGPHSWRGVTEQAVHGLLGSIRPG